MSVVTKLNEIANLTNELVQEWENEGNRDASTIAAPWPFSIPNGDGGVHEMSIDEWAAQVSALAEAYEGEDA